MKLRLNHTSLLFLILIFIQALHSTEEYFGRLWENLPPARYLTGLVSKNHETGFWIIIEIMNGIFHPAWAIWQGGYEPGVATAPLLLIVALLLLSEQIKAKVY